MGYIGVFMIIIGFGSLILEQFGLQFKVLAWADPYQPWVGILLGVIGIAIVVLGMVLGKKDDQPQQPPFPQQPYQAGPGQPYQGGPQQPPYQGGPQNPYQGGPQQ